MKNRSQSDLNRSSRSSSQLSYEALEKRNLLAGDLLSASYEFSDSTALKRCCSGPEALILVSCV